MIHVCITPLDTYTHVQGPFAFAEYAPTFSKDYIPRDNFTDHRIKSPTLIIVYASGGKSKLQDLKRRH